MKIYTKTGDEGETGLFGGARVSKANLRVDVYGHVDELNSVIGCARAALEAKDVDEILSRIQHELLDMGAELSCVPGKEEKLGSVPLGEENIVAMEKEIDHFDQELEPLKAFVLPGGSAAAAQLHLARCVCRRAERGAVALNAIEPLRPEVVRYLNRLSDLLFILARVANKRAGSGDVIWVGRDRD